MQCWLVVGGWKFNYCRWRQRADVCWEIQLVAFQHKLVNDQRPQRVPGAASRLCLRTFHVVRFVIELATMLHRNSCHRSRLATPFTSCSSSKPNSTKGRSSRFFSAKRLKTASRSAAVRCYCIHKEYARQGSTAAQQEAPAGAAGNAAGQQLLSVPDDIVLECLTILRCD